MKHILITTIAAVLLTGCGKGEKKHDLSDNKSKPLESVHPYQKIISKQEVGIGSKAGGIQVGKNENPAGKAALEGTNLVEILRDHFSKLTSSPDKFSGSNPFLPNIPELIDHWKKEIKETKEPDKRFFLKLKLIDELTRCNKNAEALALIQETEELLELSVPELDRNRVERNLRFFKALTLFRIDERKCCYDDFRSNSCIFPIIEKEYLFTTGNIKKANEIWGELLREQPWDYRNKWMFNLSNHLIGNETERKLRSVFPQKLGNGPTPGDIETSNISNKMNLHCKGLAGGVIVEDFDQNGLQDVFRTSWYFDHNCQLLLQTEPGRFSEQTGQFMLDGEVGGLNCVSTDYNNDGYVDILILRGGWLEGLGLLPNSLLKNVNGKRFENVSFETGLTSAYPSHSAVWADFNNDGWLDLVIGNESRNGAFPSEFYLNHGGTVFNKQSAALGFSVNAYVKGLSATDYDNDGDVDMFISNFGGNNQLIKNLLTETGELKFTDVTQAANVTGPKDSFSCMFFDYNNDGHEDLFVGGYGSSSVSEACRAYLGLTPKTGTSVLYRNLGNGTFQDVTGVMGLNNILNVMGLNHGDLNADGYEDIYVGTGSPSFSNLIPNRLFINVGGTNFVEKTYESRTGSLQKGHGISFADLDNDGDLEIYAALGGWYTGDNFKDFIFSTNRDFKGLKLKLKGSASNALGIGAKVEAVFDDRTIFRQLFNSSSFGNNPLSVYLGQAHPSQLKSVTVYWPSGGITQTNLIDYSGDILHLIEKN